MCFGIPPRPVEGRTEQDDLPAHVLEADDFFSAYDAWISNPDAPDVAPVHDESAATTQGPT